MAIHGSNAHSNMSNALATVSNWTDATFRKKSVNVPWSEISGKPSFSETNDSIDFAGVALGTVGLLLGGAALLNQNGQLVSTLQNVAGTLKFDPAGTINALTGAFNYNRFTQGVDIGLATMPLSNDQIFWKDGAASNMILGSNSLVVRNNQPFTISNANLNTNCNISAPTFTEGGTLLSTQYAQSNTLSNFLRLDGGYLRGAVTIIISNQLTLEFGTGRTKEANAGRIGYETYTSGALDIIGAGTTTRAVRIWNNLTVVNTTLSVAFSENGT
jgi:hypothetical protein